MLANGSQSVCLVSSVLFDVAPSEWIRHLVGVEPATVSSRRFSTRFSRSEYAKADKHLEDVSDLAAGQLGFALLVQAILYAVRESLVIEIPTLFVLIGKLFEYFEELCRSLRGPEPAIAIDGFHELPP